MRPRYHMMHYMRPTGIKLAIMSFLVALGLGLAAIGFYFLNRPPEPEPKPTAAEARPQLILLDQSLTKNVPGQLVSPDGEWLLQVKETGRSALSHAVYQYFELVNLKGKANRYIYHDWIERPEKAATQNWQALGWSPDGTVIYVGSFPREWWRDEDHPLPAGFWAQRGFVYSLDLKQTNAYVLTPVFDGSVMDYYPGVGGLQYASGALRLQPRGLTVVSLDENAEREVGSAAMSEDGSSVIYAIHEDGRNDEIYSFNAETGATGQIHLDRGAYPEVLKKQGITEPYRILIEHTVLARDKDFFFAIVGKGGKTTQARCGSYRPDAPLTCAIAADDKL